MWLGIRIVDFSSWCFKHCARGFDSLFQDVYDSIARQGPLLINFLYVSWILHFVVNFCLLSRRFQLSFVVNRLLKIWLCWLTIVLSSSPDQVWFTIQIKKKNHDAIRSGSKKKKENYNRSWKHVLVPISFFFLYFCLVICQSPVVCEMDDLDSLINMYMVCPIRIPSYWCRFHWYLGYYPSKTWGTQVFSITKLVSVPDFI